MHSVIFTGGPIHTMTDARRASHVLERRDASDVG